MQVGIKSDQIVKVRSYRKCKRPWRFAYDMKARSGFWSAKATSTIWVVKRLPGSAMG
jgi:hypothetical protein